MTLNQVIVQLTQIANNHGQIRTVFFGDSWDFLDQGDNEYTAFFFNIDSGNMIGGTIQYALEVYILDKMLQDQSNVEDVKSDCLQIGADIIGTIKMQQSGMFIGATIGDVSFEFVEEDTPDYLAGVKLTFNIDTTFTFQTCFQPYKYN